MTTETFFVKNGIASIYKTPSSRLPYGLDLVDWIRKAGTNVASVRVENVVGVTMVGEPFIDGTCIGAWFEGLDEADEAVNCCTFLFEGADGVSQDARTIHFVKRPVKVSL